MLPFTSRFKNEPVDCSSGNELRLDTSILVDIEDDEAREYFESPGDGSRGNLGYLYLKLTFVSEVRRGYASLEFVAATTQMSLLLEHSVNVERAFAKLTAASGGVCCWLNREMESLEVRWLNGERCRETIPGSRFTTGIEVARTWPEPTE